MKRLQSKIYTRLRGYFLVVELLFHKLQKRKVIIFYCTKQMHIQSVQSTISALVDASRFSVFVLDLSNSVENYCPVNGLKYFSYMEVPWRILNNVIVVTPATGIHKDMQRKNTTIHIMHSLVDIDAMYKDSAFDNFDYICCATKYHVRSFKELFQNRRSLSVRYLLPCGYPKLDSLISKYNNRAVSENEFRVIYAPSLCSTENTPYSTLIKYADLMIGDLLSNGFYVVFRPHPLSFKKAEYSTIKSIVDKYKNNDSFTLDKSSDYFEVISSCDALITDISGTAFSYSFCFERPSIFFVNSGSRGRLLEQPLFKYGINNVGKMVFSSNDVLSELMSYRCNIEKYNLFSDNIKQYRSDVVFNLGESHKYISESIASIALGYKNNKNWVKLN